MLEARGLKLTDIRTGMDHSLQSWTSDPDGNPIEFMEYTAQSLQIQQGPGLEIRRNALFPHFQAVLIRG